jgi:oligoribonuclease NrnB/cAMP/cGMP phosphodiesterase (DHH superfamily)
VEVIITHGDIDGVAAAGLYLYLRDNPESTVYFAEPYSLHRVLGRLAPGEYRRVVITDLGVNSSTLEEIRERLEYLRARGVEVAWYDHHVWDEDWISSIKSTGVELHVDRSTCATGVVAKYTKPLRQQVDYAFVEQLTRGVCAGDLWRFDHWLGPYYIRLVRRRDKDSWKRRVLIYIANGYYWSSEFDSKVERHVDLELSLLSSKLVVYMKNTSGSHRVAVVRDERVIDSSFIAPYVMGRYGVDVVAVVSSDGKISFRSRGVNVRDLAVRLGGGGHPNAAGTRIRIPWYIRLISKIRGDFLLRYVAGIITRELERLSANSR